MSRFVLPLKPMKCRLEIFGWFYRYITFYTYIHIVSVCQITDVNRRDFGIEMQDSCKRSYIRDRRPNNKHARSLCTLSWRSLSSIVLYKKEALFIFSAVSKSVWTTCVALHHKNCIAFARHTHLWTSNFFFFSFFLLLNFCSRLCIFLRLRLSSSLLSSFYDI